MTLPVFSEEWARACASALNQSPAYRTAATTWEGAVLLRMSGLEGETERMVLLDLWHGECRVSRAAGPEDEPAARYVLSGSVTAWRLVLTGSMAPVLALMTGKLSLTKGALTDLLPFVNAARELVATAAAIPSSFPEPG
jgi:putative sterol carrier protein